MTLYPDEQLEYYANRFFALGLAQCDITLVQYLADPARYEPFAMEPLLPKQQAVVLRLWHEQDTGLGVASSDAPVIDEELLVDPHALVAEWRAQAEAAERGVEHLPRRNGAIVEPLHHHRHQPRHGGAAHFKASGESA